MTATVINDFSQHTFKSCQEADEGNPVTITATTQKKINTSIIHILTAIQNKTTQTKRYQYNPAKTNLYTLSGEKLHQHALHCPHHHCDCHPLCWCSCSCCGGPLMMEGPGPHEQVRPKWSHCGIKSTFEASCLPNIAQTPMCTATAKN